MLARHNRSPLRPPSAGAHPAVRGLVASAIAWGLLAASGSQAQTLRGECGTIANHYGPYDYRVFQGPKLDIVERYHFTPKVEALAGGETTALPGDIGYTLRAFPNHHRALIAMARWQDRAALQPPPRQDTTRQRRSNDGNSKKAALPMNCWFERAVVFQPNDTVARLLYARWLYKHGKKDEGRFQIDMALQHAGDNPVTHYNIGLVALEADLHDLALAQAHKAQALGNPQTALRESLQAQKRWREPAPADAAASAPAAAGTAAADAPASSPSQ
ncbi:tetratricopeptide repeat protein [Pseudorhodoferax sp.]|uniref:tetratricopeptide repeat protein n=1 Tax=Pseudorhodoferax sp. TaxID=1993553 RepID=UPI002DD658D9|nr:hypothetical protein [Pseudorhodoferax sp.]